MESKSDDSTYKSAANFAVLASIEDHVQIALALKWLCAAIRYSSSESLSLSKTRITTTNTSTSSFTIDLTPLTVTKETSCWHSLFLHTVVASGFSIPKRTEGQGLEISFSDMVVLSRTLRLVEYDRGSIAEGSQTLLIPIKRLSDNSGVQWHLEEKWSTDPSNGRRRKATTTEILSRTPFQTCLDNLDPGALKNQRNFVGWTDSALISLGTSHISSTDFSSSGAGRPQQQRTCISSYHFGFGFSHWGGATLGATATTSSISNRFCRNAKKDLEDTLQDAEMESIVLYDFNEKIAWLCPKPSVLLFMVQLCKYREIRAYHYDSEAPVPTTVPIPIPIAPRSTAGSQVALKTIRDSFEIKLEKGTKKEGTFADYLDSVCLSLDIGQQRASEAWENATKHKKAAPKGIVGFEMMEIIKELPVLNVKEERVDQPWAHIAQDGGLVLFVKGLGQPIVPSNPASLCRNWQQVPSGRNYLAAGSSGLSYLLINSARSRLSDRLAWEFRHPTRHCVSCMVNQCRRVQLLRSTENQTDQSGLWDKLSQYEQGAFIFGHRESAIKKMFALVRSPVEHRVKI